MTETSKLSEAVCAVMESAQRLKKGAHNNHGSYDFTSVDDFKDYLRPLLAKHGLLVHTTQRSFSMIEYLDSKGGRKSCAQFDFEMTLIHKSGEKADPEGMTVALPFTGPQTSGAARSYAIKEWMKSRFLLSSGDEQDEADLIHQSKEGMRLSKAEARDIHKQLEDEAQEKIKEGDPDKLAEWYKENEYRIDTLPKDWFIKFRTDYVAAWKKLRSNVQLQQMKDAPAEPEQESPIELARRYFANALDGEGLQSVWEAHFMDADLPSEIYQQIEALYETRLDELEPVTLAAG